MEEEEVMEKVVEEEKVVEKVVEEEGVVEKQVSKLLSISWKKKKRVMN